MSKPVPYSGAPVSQTFRERWLSVNHVGAVKPTCIVEIRRGRLNRKFHPWGRDYFGYPVFGDYPGALGIGFWYPDWQVNSDWVALDGIQNIRLEQSFDNNGIQTLTLKMDNRVLVPTTGPASILYHVVQDGYYSPLRGYVGPGRPDPGIAKTPMFNQLPNAQIRIRQGYGSDQLVTTFLGLIDDIESTSQPNEITITARDHGGVLVDEHFFGWAKEMVLPSPLTFAPRSLAEDHSLVGGDADSSTHQEGYNADGVLNKEGWDWRSEIQDGPDNTQWVEITIPSGKYSQLYVRFPWAAQHVYIGIQPTGRGAGKPPTLDDVDIRGKLDFGGWFNPNGQQVPGHFGGWSYFEEIQSTTVDGGRYISLGGAFYVGDGTVVRLGFRNLHKVRNGEYQAGMSYLQANRRQFSKTAVAGKYVVIDDVSDIVRCCLRWAGFKGWEVENTGTNLKEVYVADPAKTFMDVINEIKNMVGYTFFIGEPRDPTNDQDLGYPIFRNNRVMENFTGPTEFIDDRLLLTDAKVKISNQDDRCNIRCRGIDKKDGVTIDGDSVKRVMFSYIPPWAGEQAAKVAGVIKSITHTDEKFTRLSDCQFGCYLIAIQIALLKYTAILSVPANPGIGLDTLQSVIDRKQGLNSRIYVSSRTQEMDFGPNGYWTMELGGSLVDTPEIAGVMKDYMAALPILERGGKNPWRRKRHGKVLDYGYEDK